MSEVLTPPRLQENLIDETARRYFDTATQAAEALDGLMYSEFPLGYDGYDIYSRKDGTRFGEMMQNSLDEAKYIAARNPNLEFELRRRQLEAEELPIMINMGSGNAPNTMVIVSDFPPELMDAKHDIGGYNVNRKQTMLRIITCRPDGSMELQTQSLDGSNRTALEAIYKLFGKIPEKKELLGQRIQVDLTEDKQAELCNNLTVTYDLALAEQQGGQWNAGRPVHSDGKLINTYEFVLSRKELLLSYIHCNDYGSKASLYGLIHLLSEEYNEELNSNKRLEHHNGAQTEQPGVSYGLSGEQAFIYALQQAAFRGEKAGVSYSACGGTLGPSDNQSEGNNDYLAAGYGKKTKKELSWHGGSTKKGTCVSCKEGPKEVGVKSWCKACISGHCG